MINQGWACPKCGRVYSPMIPDCQKCNEEVNKAPTYASLVARACLTALSPEGRQHLRKKYSCIGVNEVLNDL